MKRKLWNAREEGRQVAAHRQTRAEPGDNPAYNRLCDADAALGHPQFDVIGPQGGSKTPAEHTDNHHSVDARERRAVQMDKFKVTPLFGVDPAKL
ncbi:hypothetical protein D3C78_652260 [compost metagenome]